MTQLRARWASLPLRRREAVCWLLLAAPVLLLLWPLWLGGRAPLPDYLPLFAPWRSLGQATTPWNPLWYDALGQYWPWRTLLTDGLRAGALPYWTPYQLDGYSLVANGQSALFYPPNWLAFGLFGVAWGFRLTALGHLWLAGLGTYRLLRELGTSRAAALLAGMAFELSSFLVLWLPLPTLLSSAAWLPWACAGLQRSRRTGDWRPAAAAGAAVGLSALAGHPQIFYYVAVAAGVVALAVTRPRAWLAFGAAAGLVAAVQLLPLLEAAPLGHRPIQRNEAAYRGYLGRAIGAERLTTIAQPRFFGNPWAGTIDPAAEAQQIHLAAAAGAYWGQDRQGAIAPGDYAEFALYGGLGCLLLALLAVTGRGRRRGPALLYGGLALAGLILALGLPPSKLLFVHVPGWSASAGPCRIALWWCFGLAVAAGLGYDTLRALPPARRWWPAPAILVAHGLAWAYAAAQGRGLELLWSATEFGRLLGLVAIVVWLALLAVAAVRAPRWLPLLVIGELLVVQWGAVPTMPAARLDPAAPRAWLAAQVEVNADERIVVADSPRAWGFYHAPQGLILPPNLATVLGVRDAGGYDSMLLAGTKERLSQLAGTRPISPATNGNMLLLGNLRRMPRGVRAGLPSSPPGEPRALGAFLVDRPNRVTLELPPGRHVLYDTAYPGWHLYDARGAELEWTGLVGGPRSFTLDTPAVVRFVYQPRTVRLGLFLALLAWAWLGLTLAPALAARLGRRRPARAATPAPAQPRTRPRAAGGRGRSRR